MSDNASVHRLVIDRMEGPFAVVETDGGNMIDLPRWLLPPEATEGDVIRVESMPNGDSATHLLSLDRAATEAAHAASRERLRLLRERDPGGPINL